MAGLVGFFKGLGARVLYSMPATAICWSTYEFFKFVLSNQNKDNYQSSVLSAKTQLSSTTDDQIMKSTNKRYVIPKPPVITTEIQTDLTADIVMDSCSSSESTLESTIAGSQYARETVIPTTSRELPSISGVGVYSAINMNPMHTERVFDPSIRGDRDR